MLYQTDSRETGEVVNYIDMATGYTDVNARSISHGTTVHSQQDAG